MPSQNKRRKRNAIIKVQVDEGKLVNNLSLLNPPSNMKIVAADRGRQGIGRHCQRKRKQKEKDIKQRGFKNDVEKERRISRLYIHAYEAKQENKMNEALAQHLFNNTGTSKFVLRIF